MDLNELSRGQIVFIIFYELMLLDLGVNNPIELIL